MNPDKLFKPFQFHKIEVSLKINKLMVSKNISLQEQVTRTFFKIPQFCSFKRMNLKFFESPVYDTIVLWILTSYTLMAYSKLNTKTVVACLSCIINIIFYILNRSRYSKF